jgi:16S rRNA (guanine966-N2)-methyltransferase
MTLRISGGRRLKSLPGLDTRPTTGRVREALFNIWQGKVNGCRWLDLCSGYGTMGAEALLKGATWVVGIDQSPQSCTVIKENWERMGAGRFAVYPGTLPGCLGRLTGIPFDLIYFDPPYESSLYVPVLTQLRTTPLITPTTLLACEHQKGLPPGAVEGWECYDTRSYGRSALSFYRLAELPLVK